MNVIVHHQSCFKLVFETADHILDVYPDGDVRGGEVVAEGIPGDCRYEARYTGGI